MITWFELKLGNEQCSQGVINYLLHLSNVKNNLNPRMKKLHVKPGVDATVNVRLCLQTSGTKTRHIPLHLFQPWQAWFLGGDSDCLAQCVVKLNLSSLGPKDQFSVLYSVIKINTAHCICTQHLFDKLLFIKQQESNSEHAHINHYFKEILCLFYYWTINL